jgi:hypothetical protein
MQTISEQVFSYLSRKLAVNGFRVLGPHTLLFETEQDKVVVYVGVSNVCIVHDGPHVVHGIELIQILGETEDEAFDNLYLQPILQRI